VPEITFEMTELAYELSKLVFHEKIDRSKALERLEKEIGMNRGSASDYFVNFQKMMEGDRYVRTYNTEATDYILGKINLDYGELRYRNALKSVREHIEYYESLGHGRLNSIRKVLKKHESYLGKIYTCIIPEEIEGDADIFEGAKKTITINSYERNREARTKCIEYYGPECVVCHFNFGAFYGDLGQGFIHVHHLVPLADIGSSYKIEPIKDLRPVCPNCHAMLHRVNPPMTIEELKNITNRSKPTPKNGAV